MMYEVPVYGDDNVDLLYPESLDVYDVAENPTGTWFEVTNSVANGKHTYVYAFGGPTAKEGKLTEVAKDGATTNLFTKITMDKNLKYEDVKDLSTDGKFNVDVTAYGIQSEGLKDENIPVAKIWEKFVSGSTAVVE